MIHFIIIVLFLGALSASGFQPRKSDLNTSSFDLEDIISKLPAKGEIDFKEALLNSLYAQVEYLRQDLFAKNEIIKSLVSIQSEYASNYNEVKNMSNVNDGTEANKSEFPDKPLNPLYNTISTGILESTVSSDDNDFAPWEKHSLGFGRCYVKWDSMVVDWERKKTVLNVQSR